MAVTEQGFAEMTDVCLKVADGAARGRAVFVLEGGYNLDGIAASAAEVMRLLLGEPHTRVDAADQRVDPLIEAYRRAHGAKWTALDTKSV
jgi:acetoin utilization deacetylase AcuC-like enzyme